MPELPFTAHQAALEQEGLEFLRNNKFRKARDVFKILHKSQPDRALPLLIEANLGLAKEMMTKGLVSEANQVLAYLQKIAPPSFNITLNNPSDNSNDAWSSMLPSAAQRVESSTQVDSRIRAADEIILGALSPDQPDHPDAKAILTALELGYGAATTTQTSALLRTIPRTSPFSHWVFFFKGMTALETGNRPRAADFFRLVPQCSLLHASIPTLLTVCGTASNTLPDAKTTRALCAWAENPDMAAPLLSAEPLWRKNQHAKAFLSLTKDIPNLLCIGAHSFQADLSRFLTTQFIRSLRGDTSYQETLLNYVKLKSKSAAKTTLDYAYFAIDFANYPSCAHKHFSGALEKIQGMPENDLLTQAMRSRVFTHLADAYISDIKKNPYTECSGPNAKKALEHAIKYDPNNFRAWLTLCDLLSMGKDLPAYHRFLDDLTKRFPTHKEVLIRNGDCCVSRKVYSKALRNFENAAKLDAVDPRITRGILCAQLCITEDSYKKAKKTNWELVESLANNQKSHGEFALWRIRARRITLEITHGMSHDDLRSLYTATLPHSPNAFLLDLACLFATIRTGRPIHHELYKKIFPIRPEPENLSDFLAVIDEAEASSAPNCYSSAYILAQSIFNQHLTKLQSYVTERKDLIALLIKVLSCENPPISLASAALQTGYLRDPSDPIIRFLLVNYSFTWMKIPPKEDVLKLAKELRKSPDPVTSRLYLLIEKAARNSQNSAYNRKSKSANNKLDLDYDPHADDDAMEDFYDDFDPSELAKFDKLIGKKTPEKLIEILGNIFKSPNI